MKILVLGCAGGIAPGRRLSSYLVDGRVAVDAGAISQAARPERLRALLLTHAHLDHVMELPMLVTGRLFGRSPPLEIRGEPDTLRRVRKALLSDLVYPDHCARTTRSGQPAARLEEVDGPFETAGYEVTPLRMTHAYPCLAYAIRKAGSRRGAIVAGDTGDSRPLWEFAKDHAWVRAVLVEVSFPDGWEELCRRAGHLTPGMLAADLAGFDRPEVKLWAVHVKPECAREVRRDLGRRLGRRVRLARDGQRIQV